MCKKLELQNSVLTDNEIEKHSWEWVVKFHYGIIKKKKKEEEEEEKIQTQNVGDNLNAKHKNQGMRFYKDTFHSADMEEWWLIHQWSANLMKRS